MANLIIPRVLVRWGGENLSLYTGYGLKDEPLVYEVTADLAATNSNPTGSFKWNPSGVAFKVYEKFVTSKIEEIITLCFYYESGRSITLEYLWAGHQINYGNNMDITVNLRTQLDGLINADTRNITQAPDKPVSYISAGETLQKQYGLDQNKDLVKYSNLAKKDLEKAKLETYYRESGVFGAALSNLVRQNGNSVFANNIGTANLTVATPLGWEAKQNEEIYVPGPTDQDPDPAKRYGYLLGPGIINEISRSAQWTPPQANNLNAALKQPIPQKETQVRQQTQNQNQKNEKKAQERPGAVQAASSAKLNPGVRNAENTDGPEKQILQQQEAQSKLSASVFMHPFIVGIKPRDIVYVPSLIEGAKYMEDWIVENVTYHQSDGGVTISIGATRTFATGGLMHPGDSGGEKFRKIAASLNKPGQAGLDAWRKYAWNLPGAQNNSNKPDLSGDPISSRGYGTVVDY